MAFPQQFLDELVSRSDIVDIVSSYVTLNRKGSNYFGLCPFHNEKTPSFSVSPDNVYQRQPLAAASYLVVYGYLLWGAWQVFRYRRKAGGYLFMPVMVLS